MANMTEAEAAWVAGIIEGEGCIDGNASSARYARVRVEMADFDVIDRLHALVGGRVSTPARRAAHHKPTRLLTVTKKDEVWPLLDAIEPWMSSRRAWKIGSLRASVNDLC